MYANKNTTIRLLGSELNSTGAKIVLTTDPFNQLICDDVKDTDPFVLLPETETSALVELNLDIQDNQLEEQKFYFCIKAALNIKYIHQGDSKWMTLTVRRQPPVPNSTLLPLPLQVSSRRTTAE